MCACEVEVDKQEVTRYVRPPLCLSPVRKENETQARVSPRECTHADPHTRLRACVPAKGQARLSMRECACVRSFVSACHARKRGGQLHTTVYTPQEELHRKTEQTTTSTHICVITLAKGIGVSYMNACTQEHCPNKYKSHTHTRRTLDPNQCWRRPTWRSPNGQRCRTGRGRGWRRPSQRQR